MAQKRLTEFSHAKSKPSKENEVKALPFTQAVSKEKEKRAFPPVAPENLPLHTSFQPYTMEELEDH